MGHIAAQRCALRRKRHQALRQRVDRLLQCMENLPPSLRRDWHRNA